MNKKKLEERITFLRSRYAELHKYVLVDNATTTAGQEFFGEMTSIENELNILGTICPYLEDEK